MLQHSRLGRAAQPTRLVLVGAGHAHLEVLRRCLLTPLPNVELSVVSLDAYHYYSGMLPGYVAGTYAPDAVRVDVAGLVRRAQGRFIEARALGLDPNRRTLRLAEAAPVDYDLISFNLGSQAVGAEAQAVARHAVLLKPFSQVSVLCQRLQTLAREKKDRVCRIAVVGGGAAGFEVACALEAALARAGRARQVSVFEAAPVMLGGYSTAFRRRAARILAHKKIAVHTGRSVRRVHANAVELDDGDTRAADLTVWLSGAAAPPVFRGCGLALDARGFLLVSDGLHALDDQRVFGVGDCASLATHPRTPKAGVYAVRQGPVLWESLRASLSGRPLPRYRPQSGFLSILNTADGKALLRYKRLVSHSRWAWQLKDWIDRRFMARYQGLLT